MLFTTSVTIAANTAESSASTTTLRIAHGIITWVSIYFPPGCECLAHAAIYYQGHRIFPSIEDMSIVGNAGPVEWTDYYECYQPPYGLKLKCWNVDDTNAHKITVRIAILPRKAVLALAIVDAIKGFLTLISPARLFTGMGGVTKGG